MLNYAILGLLSQESRHGYDLKQAFEAMLGGTWPLNIGQVYTTLSRLERDGYVESQIVPQELLPDRKVYSLTQTGKDELNRWLSEPTQGTIRLKDEFFIKLLILQLTHSSDPIALIRKQRQVYMQTLAQLTNLLNDSNLNPSTALLIEGAILHVEADMQWLDLCEGRFTEGKS
jgi:DNA-binding PadR family transcriptional regulator